MNNFSLKDKVAIVTGALGLLGKQHCYALSEAGANVIVADLNEELANHFAKELKTKSMGCFLDVTDINSINSMMNKILLHFNKVDILINNAAINDMVETPRIDLNNSMFENYTLENWKKSIDVNLTGTFLCSQIIGKEMVKRNYGKIINIASTYGIVAPNQNLYKDNKNNQLFYKPPAYSVTKGAIISFTKYLAAYWANKNIKVNALSPGGVENKQDEYFVKNYSNNTPLGRMAKPDEYKGALIFLASEASAYMTGANLVIDGGWTIW